MVQIDPGQPDPDGSNPSVPPAQVAVGQSSIDSQAITEEAIDPSGFALGQGEPPSDDIGSADSKGQQPFAGTQPVGEEEANPIPPAQTWQSERTLRSRQIVLIASLSITSLLIAIAFFGWFVVSWRQRSTSISQPQVDSTADTIPEREQPIAAVENVDSSVEESLESQSGSLAEENAASPQISDSTTPNSTAPNSTAPNSVVPEKAISSDLIPTSPLDPDPESSDEEEPEGMRELPPEFAKYTEFLLKEGSLDKTNIPAPPTIDEVDLEGPATDDEFELAQTRPRELNLRGDLGIRLLLRSKGYPPADLLLLVGQVTTVPIEVDWVSFDLAGVDVAKNVPIPSEGKTAGDLLDKFAESLGAEFRQENALLVMTPTDARFAAVTAEVCDLADFGPGKESAIRLLMKFLKPGSDDEGPKLEIGATRHEQQLASLVVESLRRMRQIESKISDQQLSRWALPADAKTIEWPLLTGGDAGLQVDAPITIAGFLLRIARRNGVSCLINWHDLNRRGIGPETLIYPQTKTDAGKTLRSVFSHWNLQVRQVDSRHWWIGSQPTYDRLPVLVWTRPLGDHRGLIEERIEVIAAGNPSDVVRMEYDQTSDRALLGMPRYIAKQLPKILEYRTLAVP